ncbi:MAG TPA: hypothetical protein VLB68_28950 [Pyrinomonadaceae bacterium]|nr:hypothetical protein [Pyrinomonadaceae bacterium]
MLFLILLSFLSLRPSERTCECPPAPTVEVAVQNSAAVFAGEVIAEDYRAVEKEESRVLVIRFKVKRWWKGTGAAEVELYTSVRKDADGNTVSLAADFRFKKGESYLVYASVKDEKLSTSDCSRTRILVDAAEDLDQLGVGAPQLVSGTRRATQQPF